MIRITTTLLRVGLLLHGGLSADAQTVSEVLDRQFKMADQEITSLVETMPADKFNFAQSSVEIKGGEFKGVRTFAQQAKLLQSHYYLHRSPTSRNPCATPIHNGACEGWVHAS